MAFLTSLTRGLFHGGGQAALLNAWCCLLIFAFAGLIIGWLAERIVEDSVRSRIVAEIEAEQAERKPAPRGI